MIADLAAIFAALLVALGTLFVLIAALGIVRMPDLFTRMQASSKAATLGAICILCAGALHFFDGALAVRALLIAIFLGLTAPIGAHMIARAGYLAGERMRDPGSRDALEGRYSRTHELAGEEGNSGGTGAQDGPPGGGHTHV